MSELIDKLAHWIEQVKGKIHQGTVSTYPPLLAATNPNLFAVQINYLSGQTYALGDTQCIFPLMSVIKPFTLLYLLETFGVDRVFQWVGVETTDTAFNSLSQLQADGYPRNPMINSGAIALADKLPGKDTHDCTQSFCQWLNQRAGCQLYIDTKMLASVRLAPSPVNHDITQHLTALGYVTNPELALDLYENICCISGAIADLALLGKLLAVETDLIMSQHRQIVNAVMLTCGLYAASSKYAVTIGLPMKSGISGAVLAVVPGEGAIAIYSPPLDSVGNSIGAIALLEILSQELEMSIFR
ncbi:glutaminase [Calothrix sp. 336/3]|uniref:glutaminase n=1 Tax=Calothrix sp. 336/3 TaxID=1337936 RepID=UPI0004E31CBF|nr:glutaminase [Calothrix sp. 336/3]AKG22360.1 glutaminase [Calothrix sp. 336/3]